MKNRIRPRRNRRSPVTRNMVRETDLTARNFVYPMFVVDGQGVQEEISSMPGQFRWSIDLLVEEVARLVEMGLTSFALFPKVDDNLKDSLATYSHREDNFYLQAISTLKQKFPHIVLFSDVAMDPYSSDGHDGIVKEGEILNDATLEVLGKMALAQARAGVDYVAPSDMMDGRVGFIRDVLDKAGFEHVGIMAYSAKYASSFYGPFRDALDSAPKAGDKKTYQMDFHNRVEGVREALLDVEEGADIVMVKPALSYLDVIRDIKEISPVPVAAYFVSGEYSMIMAAHEKGYLDGPAALFEATVSVRRAGAQLIFTYAAPMLCELL